MPGYNAPVNITWSRKNRTPLMRMTSTGEMGPRVALRSPDGSCNPYLVLAGCLAAGLDGIRNKIEPPTCIDDLEEAQEFDILPRTLIEAVQAFEKDEFFHKVYGEELSRIIIQKKKQEWDEFCEQVTAWEGEKYLDRI